MWHFALLTFLVLHCSELSSLLRSAALLMTIAANFDPACCHGRGGAFFFRTPRLTPPLWGSIALHVYLTFRVASFGSVCALQQSMLMHRGDARSSHSVVSFAAAPGGRFSAVCDVPRTVCVSCYAADRRHLHFEPRRALGDCSPLGCASV